MFVISQDVPNAAASARVSKASTSSSFGCLCGRYSRFQSYLGTQQRDAMTHCFCSLPSNTVLKMEACCSFPQLWVPFYWPAWSTYASFCVLHVRSSKQDVQHGKTNSLCTRQLTIGIYGSKLGVMIDNKVDRMNLSENRLFFHFQTQSSKFWGPQLCTIHGTTRSLSGKVDVK